MFELVDNFCLLQGGKEDPTNIGSAAESDHCKVKSNSGR